LGWGGSKPNTGSPLLCEETDEIFSAEHEWDENIAEEGRDHKRILRIEEVGYSSTSFFWKRKCSLVAT
jgi:hypothetical protein